MMQDQIGYLPDVMANTGIKEHRILRYHTDGLTEACLSYIPDS